MELERVWISSPGARLSGLLYLPDAPRMDRRCVVLAHGMTASKASMDLLASYLAGRGWPCLSFDFRGHLLGGSEGELLSGQDLVLDVAAASRHACERLGRPRAVVVGHSVGGMAGLEAAAAESVIGAVAAVAVGARSNRTDDGAVWAALERQRNGYTRPTPASVAIGELGDPAVSASRLRHIPLLFVSARADVIVGGEAVRAAARAGNAEYAEVSGDHMGAADRARSAIASWLERTSKNT